MHRISIKSIDINGAVPIMKVYICSTIQYLVLIEQIYIGQFVDVNPSMIVGHAVHISVIDHTKDLWCDRQEEECARTANTETFISCN
jgi:hypothetical protein